MAKSFVFVACTQLHNHMNITRIVQITVVLSTLVFSSRPAAAQSAAYSDFSSTAGLTLSGNAAAVGGVLRLTPDAADQVGSAFSNTTVTLNSFSTSFQFKLTQTTGATSDSLGHLTGGDGFVFVLKDARDANIGTGSSQMGFGGLTYSLGIKFDTWANAYEGVGTDISSNSVGIVALGSTALTDAQYNAAIGGNFNDGLLWTAWIDYNPGTTSLEVRVGHSTDSRPDGAQFSFVTGALSETYTFNPGFTASTGGAYQSQDITKWTIGDHFVAGGVTAGVEVSAVPEPADFALGLGAMACVTVILRRRRADRTVAAVLAS